MNDGMDWIDPAIDAARVESPAITDAAATKLGDLLKGAFRERELPSKQVEQVATALLEAMQSHAPPDGNA